MKTGDTIHIPRFFCHAPLPRLTDKDDYAHHGSEAILKYVQEKQPKYVFHGHVHQNIGAMLGDSAVICIYGTKTVSLSW